MTKKSRVIIELGDTVLSSVCITSENGNTSRYIQKFVVFDNGRVFCTFEDRHVIDKLRANDRAPVVFDVPIKWNTAQAPDLTAKHAHMVKVSGSRDYNEYALYVPAEYAQAKELPPIRDGYYMRRVFDSPIFGNAEKWATFPGFEPYKLQKALEAAAHSYSYTGLDIAKPHGIEYTNEIISAIHEARETAAHIIGLTDEQFFAAFESEAENVD